MKQSALDYKEHKNQLLKIGKKRFFSNVLYILLDNIKKSINLTFIIFSFTLFFSNIIIYQIFKAGGEKDFKLLI